jgi:hypothetical protein
MNTTRTEIFRGCDRAMLREIGTGHAAPEVREAFRRQLMAGQNAPLLGGQVERQEDFTQERPADAKGQQLLF